MYVNLLHSVYSGETSYSEQFDAILDILVILCIQYIRRVQYIRDELDKGSILVS